MILSSISIFLIGFSLILTAVNSLSFMNIYSHIVKQTLCIGGKIIPVARYGRIFRRDYKYRYKYYNSHRGRYFQNAQNHRQKRFFVIIIIVAVIVIFKIQIGLFLRQYDFGVYLCRIVLRRFFVFKFRLVLSLYPGKALLIGILSLILFCLRLPRFSYHYSVVHIMSLKTMLGRIYDTRCIYIIVIMLCIHHGVD